MLRLLGLVYLMASLTLVNQGPALIGAHGLLPLPQFLDAVANQLGSRAAGFAQLPSIFWLADGDGALRVAGYLGVVLSVVLLVGLANTPILVSLLVLQISIAAVGQTFYGFGWELQLVETGFLATFLVPALDPRPFPRRPAARHRDLADALARGAADVGRGPDQAARRRLLARPHLPGFSLRDPADPQSADAVLSPPAAGGPRRGA